MAERRIGVGEWMKRQANRAASWSLFWLMTLGALAIAAIAAVCIAAILHGIDAATASLLGTALALLGYAARDVVGAIRALLGGPSDPPENGGKSNDNAD